MNGVGIIGFGRFGKVLLNILQKGFSVSIYDPKVENRSLNVNFQNLNLVLKQKTIFVSVPICNFESVIKNIAPRLKRGQTIIDVCSVKIYPIDVMIKNLDKSIGVIGTHPMFGPDSFQSNKELKMMMNKTRDVENQYSFWRQYFKDQGIQIFEMSAEDHDKKASQTQGVTHFLGRMLKELGIQKTTIDTQGFCDLLDLVDQTCNDSWELFKDLQLYNPYTKEMIKNLKRATEEIDKRLNN
jgi:prephenate dehydrogenase